jgi:hypothetical protein
LVGFGPKAPAGKESNWVPTDPARKFELMFRLYTPTEALFKKAWRLPDVEDELRRQPGVQLNLRGPPVGGNEAQRYPRQSSRGRFREE